MTHNPWLTYEELAVIGLMIIPIGAISGSLGLDMWRQNVLRRLWWKLTDKYFWLRTGINVVGYLSVGALAWYHPMLVIVPCAIFFTALFIAAYACGSRNFFLFLRALGMIVTHTFPVLVLVPYAFLTGNDNKTETIPPRAPSR